MSHPVDVTDIRADLFYQSLLIPDPCQVAAPRMSRRHLRLLVEAIAKLSASFNE